MTIEDLLALPARVEALELALPARIKALELAMARQPATRTVHNQEALRRLWTPEITERERELLPYLSAGWSNQEIANRMSIAERTVRTHVTNILGKLHTTNRTTVALWSMATGQVTLDQAVVLMAQQQPHLIAETAA